MGWRRRKAPAPAGPTLAELLAPWNDATCPVLTRTTRMERALVSLATHTAQLRKRVETMEQRVDGRELMMSSAPSRADIDEIREQSTRLAHDLARLSIDLREELARAVDAVRLAQTNGNAQRERASVTRRTATAMSRTPQTPRMPTSRQSTRARCRSSTSPRSGTPTRNAASLGGLGSRRPARAKKTGGG